LPITIIGWQGIGKDKLKLDSSVLIRYGTSKEQKGATILKREGDLHTILCLPFWALDM